MLVPLANIWMRLYRYPPKISDWKSCYKAKKKRGTERKERKENDMGEGTKGNMKKGERNIIIILRFVSTFNMLKFLSLSLAQMFQIWI